MKHVKRVLCVLLVLAVLVALSACGSFTPRVLIAAQRMSKLQSLHSDTTLDLEVTLSLFGEELPLAMTLRVLGDHQIEPALGAYDACATVSEYSQHMLLYTAKDADGLQRSCYSLDDGASWVVSEPQESEEGAQTAEIESGDLMKLALGLADSFEEGGSMSLPAGEGLVYEGAIPAVYLQEILRSLGAIEKLDELMPMFVDESYLSYLGDIPAKLVLDKDNSMLLRVDLDLTQALDGFAEKLVRAYLEQYGLEKMVQFRVDSIRWVTDLSEFDNVTVTLPEAMKTEN